MTKKLLILSLALTLAAMLSAQVLTNPFMNVMHSSRCADGDLRVRWFDFTENILQTECLYSANGAAWQNSIVEQYQDMQMQTLVPYEFGQSLRYRLRTEIAYQGEPYVIMHAPYLNTDSFPPTYNALGTIGTDATGDSVMVYGTMLDLTETKFGATENKFYSAMSNVAGSFPIFNSLTSYNLYATTIVNPESVVDTLAFAMLYTFNITGVISSGLYKISLDDTGMPSYTQIGNIQSQVQGGKLYMACNIADLVNDPDFGAWPNAVGALGVASLTMRMGLNTSDFSVDFGIGDYSTPAAIIFEDNHYQVTQNTMPDFINITFDNETNTIGCDYIDAQADFPLTAELELNGGDTVALTPLSYDYTGNVHYTGVLPYIPNQGTIRFSDNNIDYQEYLYIWVANPIDPLPVTDIACVMPNPLRMSNAPFRIGFTGLKNQPFSAYVYNLRGQKLGSIFEGSVPNGGLEIQWDGRINGLMPDSGMYLLRVEQNGRVLTRKFVISK